MLTNSTYLQNRFLTSVIWKTDVNRAMLNLYFVIVFIHEINMLVMPLGLKNNLGLDGVGNIVHIKIFIPKHKLFWS